MPHTHILAEQLQSQAAYARQLHAGQQVGSNCQKRRQAHGMQFTLTAVTARTMHAAGTGRPSPPFLGIEPQE